MARSVAEQRRYDRDRKRRRRAELRTLGQPPVSTLNAAFVEAMSFAMRVPLVDAGALPGPGEIPTIDMGVVMTAASDILVERGGYDRTQVRDALKHAVRRRPEHSWLSYVPSHSRMLGERAS